MSHPENCPLDLRTEIEFAKRVIDGGDSAVVAYLLGVPQEDVERVSGKAELEEEARHGD